MGANFAPINTTTAPRQNILKPRLKKAQLLFGSLPKRCSQLIFISLLSFYSKLGLVKLGLVIRVFTGFMFSGIFNRS